MAKRKKIPHSRIAAIPHALTPSLPVKGEFTKFTTPLPMSEWNAPTLQLVARHCLCADTRAQAANELKSRESRH